MSALRSLLENRQSRPSKPFSNARALGNHRAVLWDHLQVSVLVRCRFCDNAAMKLGRSPTGTTSLITKGLLARPGGPSQGTRTNFHETGSIFPLGLDGWDRDACRFTGSDSLVRAKSAWSEALEQGLTWGPAKGAALGGLPPRTAVGGKRASAAKLSRPATDCWSQVPVWVRAPPN